MAVLFSGAPESSRLSRGVNEKHLESIVYKNSKELFGKDPIK
jgi:hypothetical protein